MLLHFDYLPVTGSPHLVCFPSDKWPVKLFCCMDNEFFCFGAEG